MRQAALAHRASARFPNLMRSPDGGTQKESVKIRRRAGRFARDAEYPAADGHRARNQPVQSPFTNLTSSSLTSRSRSCCTQWPHPLSTCEPRNPGSVLLRLAMGASPACRPVLLAADEQYRHGDRLPRECGQVFQNSCGSYQAAFFLARGFFLRGVVSCPGNPRPFRAGPGRAFMSRASIFKLQLGQTSFGLILWPQGRWTSSTGTPARPAIQRSPHAVIVAIDG